MTSFHMVASTVWCHARTPTLNTYKSTVKNTSKADCVLAFNYLKINNPNFNGLSVQ